MSRRIEGGEIFVECHIVDVHGQVALLDHGAAASVVEHVKAVAAAAGGEQPIVLRMKLQTIDDALGAGKFEEPLAAGPVEDLDAGGALKSIDIADAADTADRELTAIRRKCQAANSADGTNALHAVPGIKDGGIDAAYLPAAGNVPDLYMADAIAGGQMPAIGGENADLKHGAEMAGGLLGVSRQIVEFRARGRVPKRAHHVVGNAGQLGAVG